MRELKTSQLIDHPNVVRSLGIVHSPAGAPVLIMQFYEGVTLSDWLTRKWNGEPRTIAELAQVIGGLAAGLRAIHIAGCVHRDIKPTNVVICNGSPVIMDLGVVKQATVSDQTTAGKFLGSLRYAAPEYLFGDDTSSTRLDWYSFGAVVWELASGGPYLSDVSHWAKLIVRKSETSESAEWHPLYLNAERQWGPGFAHFLRDLLTASLATTAKRVLNLQSVAEACQRMLWNSPFCCIDGTFKEGFASIGGVTVGHEVETMRLYLAKVGDHLSPEEWNEVSRLLLENYWRPIPHVPPDSIRLSQNMSSLVSAHLDVDSGDAYLFFSDELLWCYRYGVFHDYNSNRRRAT